MKKIKTILGVAAALAICTIARTGSASNYNFTTLAGNPAILYSFADGANNKALFNGPAGIAVDSLGNLFVADQLNCVIRQITPSGANWVVTTIAGTPGQYNFAPPIVNGANAQALFNFPTGIAVDASDNVYVADQYDYAIRQLTPVPQTTNWIVTTVAGNGTFGSADGLNGAATFGGPTGVAVDARGNLFVADPVNNTIRKITPVPGTTNWAVTTIAGLAGYQGNSDGVGTNAGFNYPTGVAVDTVGNIYVADQFNNSIREITPVAGTTNWLVSTIAGNPFKAGSTDGTNSAAEFDSPSGVAVDTNGNVFVADQDNFTMREIVPVGTNWVVSTIGGQAEDGNSTDGFGPFALFYYPFGLATDRAGHLYVADTDNNTIRLGAVPTTPLLTEMREGGNTFQFVLAGLPGWTCVIQASPDLSTWSPWLTNTLPVAGYLYINDPAPAVNPNRFYRAILP